MPIHIRTTEDGKEAECFCAEIIGSQKEDGTIEYGILLPCGHCHGHRCLAKALITRPECPECRTRVPKQLREDINLVNDSAGVEEEESDEPNPVLFADALLHLTGRQREIISNLRQTMSTGQDVEMMDVETPQAPQAPQLHNQHLERQYNDDSANTDDWSPDKIEKYVKFLGFALGLEDLTDSDIEQMTDSDIGIVALTEDFSANTLLSVLTSLFRTQNERRLLTHGLI